MSSLPSDPLASLERSEALDQILKDLAQRAQAARLWISPERLQALSERLLTRREERVKRGRNASPAEIEPQAEEVLIAAHQRAQADLLRGALDLVLWRSLEGRSLSDFGTQAPCHEEWAKAAAAEFDRALMDGLAVDGDLMVCCLVECSGWPREMDLAQAAQRLDPSWRSRFAVVLASMAEGRDASVLEAANDLLRCELPLRIRASLHEARATALERRGAWAQALAAHERSLALRPSPRAALAAWVLAVEHGEDASREMAWRALSATWRGKTPLGAAREGYLWREFLARRALADQELSESLLQASEVALWSDEPFLSYDEQGAYAPEETAGAGA